jgi:hypothetical protein
MRRFRFPPGVLVALLLSGAFTDPAAAERRILEAAASSPVELARRFLDRLAEGDVEGIQQLALTEGEFAEFVYPELPAADPLRNTSAGFVWNQLHLRSQSSLGAVLTHLSGRRLKLKEIRFAGGVEPYDSYVVHRESLLILEDEDGVERTERLFGAVLEMDGQFKIYSFVGPN